AARGPGERHRRADEHAVRGRRRRARAQVLRHAAAAAARQGLFQRRSPGVPARLLELTNSAGAPEAPDFFLPPRHKSFIVASDAVNAPSLASPVHGGAAAVGILRLLSASSSRRSRMTEDRMRSAARSASPEFQDVVAARLSRRAVLLGMSGAVAAGALGSRLFANDAQAAGAATLTFTELTRIYDEKDHVAPGYAKQVLIRWGDPVVKGAPAFDPAKQSVEAQQQQFGYNNDFMPFLPLPVGSTSSDHGLLCVNHEYVNPHIMWPGLTADDAGKQMDKGQVETTMAAHGHSVVEIKKADGKWQVVADSAYNRRISALTTGKITGPAAGHDWLKTSADTTGAEVIGTLDNCSGGVTPWGTVLFCEEGVSDWFGGDSKKAPNPAFMERAGYGELEDYNGWARFHD